MHLSDEQLRAVLSRAEEIQLASVESDAWNAEVQIVLQAAEEMGLSRQAIERALAERRDFFPEPPRVGQLVWARSTDDKYYVADVVSITPRGARVQFLRGGELTVEADALRPCAFLPGDRMVVDWPWWGAWTCSVVRYDAATRTVRLSDGWGEAEDFPIADVWIAPPRRTRNRNRFLLKVLLIGGAMGAAVGAVATLLALR
jgi:hypothetical protein